MNSVTASAPGKVVLSGEYAVLDGAPAVCMAIDCRASVHVSPFSGNGHRVVAPDFTPVEGRFLLKAGGVTWSRGKAEFSLVDAVLRSIGVVPAASLCIELDTRAFRDAGTTRKIGIGASAALTVALVTALKGCVPGFDECSAAHRRFQKGAGSGVDVATAIHGGLLEYRMHQAQVQPLAWPTGLHYRLVWTGTPVDTRLQLAKLDKVRKPGSSAKLVEAAARMAEAWVSTAAVLDAYPDYIDQLRQFSVDHDLGIFDAGHDRLAHDAADAGLIYKPCGAGGGDVGILLGSSDAQLDEFVAGGIRTLPCHLDPDGVMLERH